MDDNKNKWEDVFKGLGLKPEDYLNQKLEEDFEPNICCGKCGLTMPRDIIMCYSCPHSHCPLGMGPTMC